MANYDQIVYDIAIKQGFTPVAAKLVVGQARFESTNYTSNVFKANNNTHGMKFIGQPLATRGSLAPVKERSASCRNGGTCVNSDHYAKFASVEDSATDVVARLYNITRGDVTPDQLKNAKTPEEFARLLKKRSYYGFGAYGTPQAEKEIKEYAGGLKVRMRLAQIVEFVEKNKKGLGLGILLLGLGIYLYIKKK
jgi:hypothetical protein